VLPSQGQQQLMTPFAKVAGLPAAPVSSSVKGYAAIKGPVSAVCCLWMQRIQVAWLRALLRLLTGRQRAQKAGGTGFHSICTHAKTQRFRHCP
jgi:hypothetical protein